MITDWNSIEMKRLDVQADLDGAKTSAERNRMGQFATPTGLAREVVAHGLGLLPPEDPIRFLDPAIGTGAFYSALRAVAESRMIVGARGFEIDPHYAGPANRFWARYNLDIETADFTKAAVGQTELANLLICNPPYVRHHHIQKNDKVALQASALKSCDVKINGLSGLYCYFLGLAHQWLAKNGIAGWLIPSEFMDVNYGEQVKTYLLEKVTLLQIHRFDPEDGQFDDALVSSAVVWFKNASPPADHSVVFSYGGTLTDPASQRQVAATELSREKKWTRYPAALGATQPASVSIGDLFDVKRGIATGDNSFFILSRDQMEMDGLPKECFRPVLPSSRHISEDEIETDTEGLPLIDKQLFLLDTRLPETEIKSRYPSLHAYLQAGHKGENPTSSRYLCRARKPWYAQEKRSPALFMCTYMGRPKNGDSPFRFILNHSQASACNVYLMLYPKEPMAQQILANPDLKYTIWEFLKAIPMHELIGKGRVYGGGLYKMEPKELRSVSAEGLVKHLVDDSQFGLFEKDVA